MWTSPMLNRDQLGTHMPGAGFVTGIPTPTKHPDQTPMMNLRNGRVPATAAPSSSQTDATTAIRVQPLEQNMHQWIAQGDIAFLLNPSEHSMDGAHVTMPLWMLNYYLEMAHRQQLAAYSQDVINALGGVDALVGQSLEAADALKRKREELAETIPGKMPLQPEDVVKSIVPLGVVRGELDWGDAWGQRMSGLKRHVPGLVARELTISHLGESSVGDLWSAGRQLQNGTIVGFRVKKVSQHYSRFLGAQGETLDPVPTEGAFLQFIPEACTSDVSNCAIFNSNTMVRHGNPAFDDLSYYSYMKRSRLVTYREDAQGRIDFSVKAPQTPAQRLRNGFLKINTLELGQFVPLGRVIKCPGKTPSESECLDGMRTKQGYERLMGAYPLLLDLNFGYRYVY